MLRNWIFKRLRDRKRLIYRFHDGANRRCADPLLVSNRLFEHPSYVRERHLTAATQGDTEAQNIVAQAACDAFDVQPLSSNGKYGLTIKERIQLMIGFDAYIEHVKKNTAVSQIPQQPTELT